MAQALGILFEDEHFIAVNKPSGLLVHRTNISEDTEFLLQNLRNQINQKLFPVHRLDRGTSGVILMAKDRESAAFMGEKFRNREVDKNYLAIVRGFTEATATIEYALTTKKDSGHISAITHYHTLGQSELPVQIGRYPTSRFSLVTVHPETGRFHQIRRHFSHLRHPIIGDNKHGDVKHNRFFREEWDIQRLLLHARSINFIHPHANTSIRIDAPLPQAFLNALEYTRLNDFYQQE